MNAPFDCIEAWVDVGGTFTDCYVRSGQGVLRRTKILSSGKVPISVQEWSSANEFISPELLKDARNFWVGAKCIFYATDQESREVRRIIGFAQGCVTLDRNLDDFHTYKSAELDSGLEAPVLATRRLLEIPLAADLPSLEVRIGTTKGTNALLTRQGAKSVLAITSPFEDLMTIGDQTRPKLFELAIEKSPPLAELAIGIDERIDARGGVLQPLDREKTLLRLLEARQLGFESLAICLMHAYVNPVHEKQVLKLAQQAGFSQVSCSHQLAPLIEIVARAQTTIVDAYLSPIVRGYLARLVEQFGGRDAVRMHVMTSSGGLVDWRDYFGKDSILSGPAGGVAALRHLSVALGSRPLIGLDMGGTSTDVCRVGSDESLQYESTKAGVRILTPTLPIETVASGGGSVCWFDGVSLRVGPQSAGALPGPACYGRGGPLTVTDVNVYVGRIPPSQFPFPIDSAAIAERLQVMFESVHRAAGLTSVVELANGFRRIANEQMAEAVRTVSISQGVDPRDHALVGFGGAAGQHICEIAESLGIQEVFDSSEAGLLSALGMGLAEQRLDAALGVYQMLTSVDWSELENRVQTETKRLTQQLQMHDSRTSAPQTSVRSARWLQMRYANTDSALAVPWLDIVDHPETVTAALLDQFQTAHRARYGYVRRGAEVELVSVRIDVSLPRPPISRSESAAAAQRSLIDTPDAVSREISPALYARSALQPHQQIAGPCVVLNQGSTLFVELGWEGTSLSDGTLHLRRSVTSGLDTDAHDGDSNRRARALDPVFRDCYAQRLAAIATQMGVVLQQTAVSVNVKQRRDYSCAVFDSEGRLLASAPHVPVHLGAMGKTVRCILEDFHDIRPGDSFITNDPYRGGSHLPDVTVIAPVFSSLDALRPVFFVANRAHHADIGGVAPGSMSVLATRLGEEGVVIEPMRLTASVNGDIEDRREELKACLQSAEFPPRNIQENLADIAAQQAANARGAELLRDYAASTSWTQLEAYSAHVLDAAEQRVQLFLRDNYSGTRQFEDHLDDSTVIRVALTFKSLGGVTIDFTGSGPTNPANLNANPSIVTAAIIYVLRCLIADDLPLNEGVMRCVELIVPEGVLNPSPHKNAAFSPAVAAGNVETSQRVVDVLLGAFEAAAASQGTMNNLLFGNQRFGFYETICGGAGATAGKAGASGVHTHMTNTRLTDPEVLESRYPVRLIKFGLRRGSGGAGMWTGGDGVVRVIEFLEPVELSLLTSRRGPFQPFGLCGGGAGALGHNTLIKLDGRRLTLGSSCQVSVQTGERLEIQTPGGGGFGSSGQD